MPDTTIRISEAAMVQLATTSSRPEARHLFRDCAREGATLDWSRNGGWRLLPPPSWEVE